MDEAERDRLLTQLVAQHYELAVLLRHERDLCRDAGQETPWFDEVITGLERVEHELHSVEVRRAIQQTIERHGDGPWTAEDLAAITGVNVDDLGETLDMMAREGTIERRRMEPPPGEDR